MLVQQLRDSRLLHGPSAEASKLEMFRGRVQHKADSAVRNSNLTT